MAKRARAGTAPRLRQRLLDAGPRGFHDYELVEYLLTLTIPRVDTKPLAKRLLARFRRHRAAAFGERRHACAAKGSATPASPRSRSPRRPRCGCSRARIEERPILSSWDALGDYLHAAMAHREVEEVRILFLNAKNMLIANEALWQGSVDEASVHVREVIARAIALGATAIIIVHNHPSGDPTPVEPGHPPDPRPDRRRPAHEDHGPRPCHRRRTAAGRACARWD